MSLLFLMFFSWGKVTAVKAEESLDQLVAEAKKHNEDIFYDPYKISREEDKFEGFTTYTLVEGGKLFGCSDDEQDKRPTLPTGVYFDPQKYTFKNGKVSYKIKIVFESSNWLFIGKGKSLVLLVDDKKIIFSGPGSKKRETSENGFFENSEATVKETAFYSVTKDQLIQISNANEVRVRIIGEKENLESCFNQHDFVSMKRFVKEMIQ